LKIIVWHLTEKTIVSVNVGNYLAFFQPLHLLSGRNTCGELLAGITRVVCKDVPDFSFF